MKFNLVNADKLQIIISRDDMAQRDMRKWDLVPHNPEAQKLFQEILEEARDACGFDVGRDAQLMIEAYPMTGDSMLVTVTKISGEKSSGDFDFSGLGQMLDDGYPSVEDMPDVSLDEEVYRFAQLEDAIQAAMLVRDQYDGASQLFRYKEQFFLALLETAWLTDRGAVLMQEYADIVPISAAFFQEHGEIVMEENAFEILSSL